jgi:uncharacterized protein (TIGR04141 family)
LALIDKKLLRLKGQTAIEAGDLMSSDGRLMHVKLRKSSSVMSHVTAQAIASTELLRSDSAARAQAISMLKLLTPAPPNLQTLINHFTSFDTQPTVTVEIVIAGEWPGGIPTIGQIPLLTRLNIGSWIRRMPVARRIVLVGT